jgi:hypothetical protein
MFVDLIVSLKKATIINAVLQEKEVKSTIEIMKLNKEWKLFKK